MVTEKELYIVKMAAFHSEIEKLGTALGSLLKMFPRFSKGLSSMAAKAPKSIIPKTIPTKYNKLVIDEASSMGWVNKNLGLKGPRTMWGTKTKIKDVVDMGKASPKFFSNPVAATREAATNVMRNQASNLEHIKNKGLWDFTKQEFNNSKYFTRTVTKNGKKYGVRMERSRLGKAANPLLGTGAGFGAFDLATNAKDEEGKKQSLLKRVGKAASTTLKWGVGAPVMGAKMVTYDIPKGVYDATKGLN